MDWKKHCSYTWTWFHKKVNVQLISFINKAPNVATYKKGKSFKEHQIWIIINIMIQYKIIHMRIMVKKMITYLKGGFYQYIIKWTESVNYWKQESIHYDTKLLPSDLSVFVPEELLPSCVQLYLQNQCHYHIYPFNNNNTTYCVKNIYLRFMWWTVMNMYLYGFGFISFLQTEISLVVAIFLLKDNLA